MKTYAAMVMGKSRKMDLQMKIEKIDESSKKKTAWLILIEMNRTDDDNLEKQQQPVNSQNMKQKQRNDRNIEIYFKRCITGMINDKKRKNQKISLKWRKK